mmetsp:Transcript_118683/g.369754  ORF Transcript_118683/g.369754 Transcript_118683/m.369754 type:complete len:86 (-) Transcript_118683:723-980(-)
MTMPLFGEVTAARTGAAQHVVVGKCAPGPGVGTEAASVLVALRTTGAASGLSPSGPDTATAFSSLVATHGSCSSQCPLDIAPGGV